MRLSICTERSPPFRGSDGRWLDAERERRRDIASDVPFARHAYLRLQSIEPALMIRFFAEDSDVHIEQTFHQKD